MDAWQLTLAVNVATLVLRTMKTVHLAIGTTVGATIHVETVLRAVVVVERSGTSRPNSSTAPGSFKPVRVESAALHVSSEIVHALTTILLNRCVSDPEITK